ncbi:hypothetical protein [Plantactinospora mayteni]|uniref:hypothetical protein n=1 Tax=Plantactinospora mayteni TaxID=566021 RepID=UPI001942E1C7|nr:hypothetical protein [Plantactinospora mayteni]
MGTLLPWAMIGGGLLLVLLAMVGHRHQSTAVRALQAVTGFAGILAGLFRLVTP